MRTCDTQYTSVLKKGVGLLKIIDGIASQDSVRGELLLWYGIAPDLCGLKERLSDIAVILMNDSIRGSEHRVFVSEHNKIQDQGNQYSQLFQCTHKLIGYISLKILQNASWNDTLCNITDQPISLN